AQPGQFVRLRAQAAGAAPPPAQAQQQQQHHFSAHQPLVRTQSVAFASQPSAPPSAPGAAELHNSLQGDGGAALPPTALPRPRGRSEDGSAHQQILLQDERQKLFEQIKDYNQQQLLQQQQQKPQQPPPGPAFPLEHRAVGSDGGVDESPLPPPSDLNDNPLKAQDTPRPKANPLRQQQQQQQLQAQLQKQFQLQLLQRQELIRQLKQALANTPAPTHRRRSRTAPAARLGNSGRCSTHGQQLQIFDAPQQRVPSPQLRWPRGR
ncbi:Protein of unknown function, partial [Gryllus bimaculatus]